VAANENENEKQREKKIDSNENFRAFKELISTNALRKIRQAKVRARRLTIKEHACPSCHRLHGNRPEELSERKESSIQSMRFIKRQLSLLWPSIRTDYCHAAKDVIMGSISNRTAG